MKEHLHCRCMNLGKQCPNNHYSDCKICGPAPTEARACCEKCPAWVNGRRRCAINNCPCHSEARQEEGDWKRLIYGGGAGRGWRERFNGFLRDNRGQVLTEIPNKVAAFIEAELKATEERTRREVLEEMQKLVDIYDPQISKEASSNYWGNQLRTALDRLQGNGGEANQ